MGAAVAEFAGLAVAAAERCPFCLEPVESGRPHLHAPGEVRVTPPGYARRAPCRHCPETVVVAELAGGLTVALDDEPVLPPTRCPLCRQVESRGHDRGPWCWRCGNTGMIGDPLPQPGVALDPDGRARAFAGRPRVGEAVYRLHACGP